MSRALAASRPLFWLNSAAPCVIAAILAERPPDWRAAVAVAFATWPLNLFVYGVNDLHDHASDRRNPRKGTAEGARLGRSELRGLLPAMVAANVPFVAVVAVTGPPAALLALVATYAVAWAYSAPPLRLKARPGWDSLANAAYALPLVFAAIYLEVPEPPWREAAAFAVWAVGSHALTSIQDIAADRAAGLRTIATALGARGAAAVAIAAYAATGAIIGEAHPVVAGLAALYVAIALRVLVAGAADAGTPHRAYRVFMATNVAAGFAITTWVALAHPARAAWAAAAMLAVCGAVAVALVIARRAQGAARGPA